ncbi:MAG: 2'-5' RNA ligase family protein [Acidobacteriia bacterium]|nr:2'-5' RNA ligase family protein [Terriglobia bacterium]
MAICAVNYPTISSGDYEWIQSIRREHDALFFDVVRPHFTLVFPTENVEKSEFIAHVAEVAKRISPFDVVLRCAILGDPSFMDHAHAFLVPDEGFSDVVRLHDALYTGPLRAELRLDLPFIPHIGVASTPRIAECKAIVDDLNSKGFEIHARVEKLDIIGYDGNRTWTIEECALGRATA